MVVGVLMSDQLNLEQHSKLPQIFREKKPSRKLLQKQACPLPLSHEKTSNNKEHVSSEKRSALIASKLHEIVCFEKIISI